MTIEQRQLFSLMQFAGGTFPTGGFSQSWGLETYVALGAARDAQTFNSFLKTYLASTVSRCEGPILCAAYRIAPEWKIEAILELEEFSRAVKVTKESREASLRMGKAFLRIAAELLADENICRLRQLSADKGISYPVAYGLVCGSLGLGLESSLGAFVFSAANALVQSGVKLIPLGNTQAQKLLLDLQPLMETCVDESINRPLAEVSNFCPAMDIAGIVHETLPVRLYMS